MTGRFVVVEGPDGSGKTTAVRLLAERLTARGLDVVVTRNVGGTPLAERLRGLFLDQWMAMDPTTQATISAAARRSNLVEVVRPALAAGRFVLCDRFVASTLVFQTLNREGGATVDDATVIEMHRLVCDDQAPDLTLHVHAPTDVRLARRNARAEGHDRFDNGDASFDAAVAAKYASAGRVLGHPTIDVDGSGTPDDTVDAMMVAVAPLLPAGS